MEDISANQLPTWKKEHEKDGKITARSSDGIPYKSLTSTLTCGPRGPPLLQDTECIGILQNFARKYQRLRVVHGKGTGARGYFKLTNQNFAQYSKACIFQPGSENVPILVRFGLGFNESQADSGRFFYAMSIKFYTEDGDYDVLNLNQPAFTFRDPILFNFQNNSEFPNQQTYSQYTDRIGFWDFLIARPEMIHRYIFQFSDRGQPATVRHVNQFPLNIFKLVNKDGDFVYARFQFKTNLGVKFLTDDQASVFRKADPDYAVRDLYNSIERGDFPSWTWYVQIMQRNEVNDYNERTGWSPFDVTKIWPQSQFPLIEIGQIVLDKNVEDHFREVESVAFFPGHFIPGIQAALEDRVLHGRIFAYHDAQMYRVGKNKIMLPANQPTAVINKSNKSKKGEDAFKTYYKGGKMNYDITNQGGQPIYYPNSFGGPEREPGLPAEGEKGLRELYKGPYVHTCIYMDRNDTRDQDNFSQPKIFYEKVLSEDERIRLAQNITRETYLTPPDVQKRVVKLWSNVSEDLGRKIEKALKMWPDLEKTEIKPEYTISFDMLN